ncbi:MAG: Rid family detoxifying hydrolase [Myxococcota bacterium]
MEQIFTEEAPRPVGPYSQAIVHGGLVFVAGQVALDPASGKVRGETIEEQTRQTLENLDAVLRASRSGLGRLLRVTVFLSDLGEFSRFNRVYEQMLGGARPARTTVQAGGLPLGLKVEVDAIAATG